MSGHAASDAAGIWAELTAGAHRGHQTHPVVDPVDHSPVAVVLTCSDARIPPALVFDQSRNRLFEIRVAGGLLDDAVREAIDFAVDHLHVPLVVVLGHEHCAAMKLATDVRDGRVAPDTLPTAVAGLRAVIGDAQGIDAVRTHVRETAATLRSELGPSATVVGAVTHLGSGDLEIVAEPS
jgi:carbonic anhydrase